MIELEYNKKVFIYTDKPFEDVEPEDFHSMLEFSTYEKFDAFWLQYARGEGIFEHKNLSWVDYEYLKNHHKDIFDMFVNR